MEKGTTREVYLDWIRVIATACVFLYHCSMFFNPFPWHVKNNVINSGSVLVFSLFIGTWIMPLFFGISGITAKYSLAKRTNTAYLKERLLRLGLPLVFGVLFLTPHQVFIERKVNEQFNGTFLEFIPHYFDGLYLEIGGTGNFAFFGLHLWYLLALLIFSVAALPVFRRLRRNTNRTYLFFLLPIILMVSGLIKTQALGGWDLVYYFMVFMIGYFFFSNPSFLDQAIKSIKIYYLVAAITTILHIYWFIYALPLPGTIQDWLFFMNKVLNCWCMMLCIFHVGKIYFSFSSSYLRYLSEASMPFYIFHQPVIVVLGFALRNLDMPLYLKMVNLVTVSFAIIMICYHFVIRKLSFLRLLFGLKPQEVSVRNNPLTQSNPVTK